MGLARSSFYDAPSVEVDEEEIVARIQAICEEFEMYGYRRVGAALRQQGIVVNGKKVRRLMRVLELQPRRQAWGSSMPAAAMSVPIWRWAAWRVMGQSGRTRPFGLAWARLTRWTPDCRAGVPRTWRSHSCP